jgi:hypothetical protein
MLTNPFDYPRRTATVRVPVHGRRKKKGQVCLLVPNGAAYLLREHGYAVVGSYRGDAMVLPADGGGDHIETTTEVLTEEGALAFVRDSADGRPMPSHISSSFVGIPGEIHGTESGDVVYFIRGTDYRQVIPRAAYVAEGDADSE